MKLVAGGKKDSDDRAGDESATREVPEMSVVDDGQRDEGKGHAEKVEEEGRDILESVFDQGESRSPDSDDEEE